MRGLSALVLVTLLVATPAWAQRAAERRVAAALDTLVALARAGDEAALAARLACAGEGGGLRPCTPTDADRTAFALDQLRADFGARARYSVGGFAMEPGADGPLFVAEVAVRDGAGTRAARYSFTDVDGALLAVEAGPHRPRTEREWEMLARGRLADLLALCGAPEAEEAAPFFAAARPEAASSATTALDPARGADRADARDRLAAICTRFNPLGGYDVVGYERETEPGEARHVLLVRFRNPSAPAYTKAAFTFVPVTAGTLALHGAG